MKKISLLLASLCLSATGLTFAAPAKPKVDTPCGAPCPAVQEDNCLGIGPRLEKGDKKSPEERWKARFAEKNQRLHDKLGLSATQEKDWEAYMASVEKLGPSEKNKPLPPEEFEKLTAPERLEKMLEHMKVRQAQLEAHLDAVKKFYGTLNADQKKIFDQESMPRGPFGFKGGPKPPRK